MLVYKPGRLMCRKVFSSRSASCPCQSTRTICRTTQTSDLKHNSREGEAGICRASKREELQHWSFPFRLPTNRL